MKVGFGIPYPHQRSSFETLLSRTLTPEIPLWVNHVRTSPGFNVSELPRHVIGLHLGKSVAIAHIRGRAQELHYFYPGDAIFTPMGDPIWYAHAEEVDALYIDVLPEAVDAAAAQLGIDPRSLHFIDKLGTNDPFLFHVGRELLAEVGTPRLGSRLYLETLSTQIMLHLLRQYTTATAPTSAWKTEDIQRLRARLHPVLEYVKAHYPEDISLSELASVMHLTPPHFSRLFKRAFGLSPYQYVIQQRVEAARGLLNDPSLTVSEVALQVGFADHSHLIRHHKRLTGTTPRAP